MENEQGNLEVAKPESQFLDRAKPTLRWPLEEMMAQFQDDSRRCLVLAEEFQSVKRRLDLAAAEFGEVVERQVEMASRHVLCAEALMEVLEARLRTGRVQDATEQAIRDEYWSVAIAKVKRFSEREATEQHRIENAYKVLPQHIVAACERGLIDWEEAPGLLEELMEYCVILTDLLELD